MSRVPGLGFRASEYLKSGRPAGAPCLNLGFGVWGLGFGVRGSGFGVRGLGFRV